MQPHFYFSIQFPIDNVIRMRHGKAWLLTAGGMHMIA